MLRAELPERWLLLLRPRPPEARTSVHVEAVGGGGARSWVRGSGWRGPWERCISDLRLSLGESGVSLGSG